MARARYQGTLQLRVSREGPGEPLQIVAEAFTPQHVRIRRSSLQEILPDIIRLVGELIYMADYEGPQADTTPEAIAYRAAQISSLSAKAASRAPLFGPLA